MIFRRTFCQNLGARVPTEQEYKNRHRDSGILGISRKASAEQLEDLLVGPFHFASDQSYDHSESGYFFQYDGNESSGWVSKDVGMMSPLVVQKEGGTFESRYVFCVRSKK